MEINASTYYEKLIAELKGKSIANNICFGTDGFSYTSNSMGLYFDRISKNHYQIKARQLNSEQELYNFEGVTQAVNFAIKLIKLDLYKQRNSI